MTTKSWLDQVQVYLAASPAERLEIQRPRWRAFLEDKGGFTPDEDDLTAFLNNANLDVWLTDSQEFIDVYNDDTREPSEKVALLQRLAEKMGLH